ncbi:hypothetical protein G7Y89_g5987 [Cudoniella acicularis]|uniref:Uncharacterized protein n=1 Tax=Cudoniella acicularis TaxID=354080 RepID=A0A8H4W3G0_9HELO|nr:hypothetical protein G7Y89_g5987 [Cudoniella acicularis]
MHNRPAWIAAHEVMLAPETSPCELPVRLNGYDNKPEVQSILKRRSFIVNATETVISLEAAATVTLIINKTIVPSIVSSTPVSTSVGLSKEANNLLRLTDGQLENATLSALPMAAQTMTSAVRSSIRAAASGMTTKASAAAQSASPTIAVIAQQTKGPFAPPTEFLGGVPTTTLDVPITAVFLVLFIIGAATHFITHELNGKRGHKFHLSDMVFDFCMVRTVTTTMRIVWAFRPNNTSIVLAALIFENAGVVVLFAVNAIFTQRIIRAIHPNFGRSPVANTFFLLIIISVPFIIIHNITFTIVSFFTLDTKILGIARGFLLFGLAYTLTLCILPILLIVPAGLIPSATPIQRFGTGHFRTKVAILISASLILMAGALVRIISAIEEHRLENPGRVNSKAVFYTTGFMLEIIVVAMYALVRIDLRFWVPDGCKGPGDYITKDPTKAPVYSAESDEESFFQDVDVKMRMSLKGPTGGLEAQQWVADANSRKNPSREQVRQAIYDLGFQTDVVGPPIDSGDSEVLIYAFRVRKQGVESPGLPRRPPRAQNDSWLETRSVKTEAHSMI